MTKCTFDEILVIMLVAHDAFRLRCIPALLNQPVQKSLKTTKIAPAFNAVLRQACVCAGQNEILKKVCYHSTRFYRNVNNWS